MNQHTCKPWLQRYECAEESSADGYNVYILCPQCSQNIPMVEQNTAGFSARDNSIVCCCCCCGLVRQQAEQMPLDEYQLATPDYISRLFGTHAKAKPMPAAAAAAALHQQAEQMLLEEYHLATPDIPRLFEAEPWLIEPGALIGSLLGFKELFKDRDPAKLLLQHACTGGSKLLLEFKQQAMEACQIATEYMGGRWLY